MWCMVGGIGARGHEGGFVGAYPRRRRSVFSCPAQLAGVFVPSAAAFWKTRLRCLALSPPGTPYLRFYRA